MLRAGLLVFVWSFALGAAARAEPVVVGSGRLVLPITGLALELPAHPKKGASWQLSSSWNLTPTGEGFDGRDVLDEKVGDTLIAGNWVHVGHFHAGRCDAVVRDVELDGAWQSKVTIAGREATVRGGVFTFEGSALGRKATAVLCFERQGRKQLLLHRFLLDRPEAMTQEAVLEALAETPLVERVVVAWAKDRVDPGARPLRRSEVRRRGGPEAVRDIKLAKARLSLRLPDDGLIWMLGQADADQPTDWLELMAPAMPEVSVEVLVVDGVGCGAFFAGLGAERRPGSAAKNLPEGWLAGPTLIVDGEPELTTCTPRGADALVVGLFVQPLSEDVARYGPLLEAIAAGAAAR